MKKTLNPRIKQGIVGLLGGAMLLSGITLVQADTLPTIDTTIRNASNVTITQASIGTLVHNRAVVASSTASTTPTGTVDFSLYDNTSCSGSPTIESGVALVDGVASSSATSVGASGLSFIAHYNGDATNTPVTSSCESLTATSAGTSINTTLSTTSVDVGSSVHDSATLSGETANAGGTVTYSVFTNNSCSSGYIDAGTKSVTNGNVPNSNSLVFNSADTYYWQAVYSGDANNMAATSSCASEVLVIHATTSAPVGTGTIQGTVFNDKNKNDVKDTSDPGLSGWKIKLHSGKKISSPVIETTTTDGNGHYSFTNHAFGNYYVEEVIKNGWKQTTSDTAITLSENNSSETVDFANIEKNNSQNNKPDKHFFKKFRRFFRFYNRDSGNYFDWFQNGR